MRPTTLVLAHHHKTLTWPTPTRPQQQHHQQEALNNINKATDNRLRVPSVYLSRSVFQQLRNVDELVSWPPCS